MRLKRPSVRRQVPRKKPKLRPTVKLPKSQPLRLTDKPDGTKRQKNDKLNWMPMPQRSRPHWTQTEKPARPDSVNGKRNKLPEKQRSKSAAPKPRHVPKMSLNVLGKLKMKPRLITDRPLFQSASPWPRRWKTSRMTPP